MDGKMYLILALVLALGFLIRFVLVYLRAKSKLIETDTEQQIWKHAPELIAEAEEAYKMVEITVRGRILLTHFVYPMEIKMSHLRYVP